MTLRNLEKPEIPSQNLTLSIPKKKSQTENMDEIETKAQPKTKALTSSVHPVSIISTQKQENFERESPDMRKRASRQAGFAEDL